MQFPVLNYREDFPDYPQDGIYLDNLSRSLLPKETIKILKNDYFNYPIRMALHKRARDSLFIYSESKEKIARFLEVSPERIAVMSNPDLTWNILLQSYLIQNPGIKLFINMMDHHSIISPAIMIQKNLIWMKEENMIDLINKQLEEGDLVVLGDLSTILGTKRRIIELYDVIHRRKGKLAVDFSRTAGQFRIELDFVDFAVIDGSIDLLGPANCTILYSREDIKPSIVGSGVIEKLNRSGVTPFNNMEGFEPGIQNLTQLKGLAKSIEFIESLGLDAITKHRIKLQETLLSELMEIEKMSKDIKLLNPNRNFNDSLIFSLGFRGDISSHDVALMLDEMFSIAVRSGQACSHMGLNCLGIKEALQISTHVYNSVEEMKIFGEKLAEVIRMIT